MKTLSRLIMALGFSRDVGFFRWHLSDRQEVPNSRRGRLGLSRRRLWCGGVCYVSHGTKVEILNLDSGDVLGSIPTIGVHGIALAPELGRGFISDGKASKVLVFDLKSMKVVQEIPSPKDPDAILYDPATSRIFAFNGDSDNATVIDAASGKVAGTIDLGGGREFAVADGAGYVFNNLEDKSLVVKINARTLKVEQRWPTAPCASPSSMAIDRPNHRLFVGCRSKVMAVINSDTVR